MKRIKALLSTACAVLLLSGCASNKDDALVFAEPVQIDFKLQSQLTRINQFLNTDQELSENIVAKLFYDRGIVLDTMGLKDLALLDFNQSLSLDPNQPEVFNILGIYYTQSGKYSEAYEAFDSALELKPNHVYAQRNRGIALYYGGRPQLAIDDLSYGYAQDRTDPFGLIWLYLSMTKDDASKAHKYLVDEYKRYAKQHKTLGVGWELLPLLIDAKSDRSVLANYERTSKTQNVLAHHLCEAYFYIAKREQLKGDEKKAKQYFKLSMMTNVLPYIEHRYSSLELRQMDNKVKHRQ